MTVRQWGMRDSDMDIQIPLALMRKLGLDHHVVRSSLIMDPEFIKIYKTNALLAHNQYLPDAQAILKSYALGKVCVVGGVSELVRDPTVGTKRSIDGRMTPAEISAELYGLGKNQYAIAEIEKWFAGLGQIHNLDRDAIFYWEQRAANWLAMNQVEFDSAWRDIFVPYNCRGLLMAMLEVREKDRHAPHNRLHKELIRNLWPEVLSEPVNPHKPRQLAIMKGKLRAQAKRWLLKVPQLRRRFESEE